MKKRLIQPGNNKLHNMFMFNIPASMEVCGRICKGCYAIKEQRYPSVVKGRQYRLEASKLGTFVSTINDELKRIKSKPKYFRIHASGEFYSQDYIDKWVEIVSNNKQIHFYAYTKRLKDFDFSKLKALNNMSVIDSFHYGRINYGPENKLPENAYLCEDYKPEVKCGQTCTYCMQKGGAEKNGVFFKQH